MKFILLFLLASISCSAGTYIPGQVSSPVIGRTFVVAEVTNNGATCALSYNPGGWVASVTRVSAGRCDIDITGYFTATPVCVVGCSDGTWGFFFNGLLTNTVNTVECRTSGNTATDATIELFCYGAK